MNLDVTVATYNSSKTLMQCLHSIRENVDVSRIIAIDHKSTDDTLTYLQLFQCCIYQENRGLGHARQLQINLADTELFLIVDSDVVLDSGIKRWLKSAKWHMDKYKKLGAFVGCDPDQPISHPTDRFWQSMLPYLVSKSFTLHCTILRKSALRNIKIKDDLEAAEDYAIMKHLKRRGYTFMSYAAPIKHIGQFSSFKTGEWMGANFNAACTKPLEKAWLLIWKGLLSPIKLVPYFIFTKDFGRVKGGIKHSIKWTRGFLQPHKFMIMERQK